MGEIEVSKSHPLSEHTSKYGITGKLQEIMCLLGQGYVFEEGEEILKTLLGVEMSAKQIERVSEHYGAKMEEEIQGYAQNEKAPVLRLKGPEEPVYAMFDGSMLFTREEQWKEIKVGRVFTESSCVSVQENESVGSGDALFAPPMLIAGIYGMNFSNMPELQTHDEYFITLGIMFFIFPGMILFFRKRGWF